MSKEEAFLLEKAKENLKATEVLLQQGFSDIAASRVYYAMFYLAEALLQRRGLSYSSHAAVIAAYGKEFARTGDLDPKFQQYLIKSQALRQTGDYGRQEFVSPNSVRQALDWADEFLIATEAYLR